MTKKSLPSWGKHKTLHIEFMSSSDTSLVSGTWTISMKRSAKETAKTNQEKNQDKCQ